MIVIRARAMRRAALLLLLLLVAAAPARPSGAAGGDPPPAAAMSRAQAATALAVLENPARRDAFIATLKAIVQGTAPGGAAAAEPVKEKPAIAGGAEPAKGTAAGARPVPRLAVPLAPGSLGAQFLVQVSAALGVVGRAVMQAAATIISLPLLSIWLATVKGDPFLHELLLAVAWRMAVVVALGLLVEKIATLALATPRAAILRLARGGRERGGGETEARGGEHPALHYVQSAGLAVGAFLLELPPVVLFVALAFGLLETGLGAEQVPRLAILAVVNAYALTRFLLCFVRLLMGAEAAALRLLPASDAAAAYAMVWARRIIAVSVFGYAAAEVAALFGVYDSLRLTLIKLVGLVVHLFVVAIILQKRQAVRRFLSARPEATGPVAGLRRVIGRFWHYLAISYVLALWVVWAIGVQHGFVTLLRFFITALIVFAAAWGVDRLLLRFVARHLRMRESLAERYPGYGRRTQRYAHAAQRILSFVIAAIAFVVLLELWGVDAFGWFSSGGFGGRVAGAVVVIGITVAAALFVWEATNAAIERHLARLARDGQAARAARINTLLPMLRASLIVTIGVFVGLTALSEIGLDIAPLLAGAGVIGIAIGFGSQKLVQDIITGLFLLLENAMQVGDVVTLGGLSGVVENVSVRSIRLRASDGSVHLIPFSAVSTVTNQTRDFGYAVFNVSVAYKEDVDRVIAVLKEIVTEMQSEPEWGAKIRDALEVWGLDQVAASALVIACRVRTGPSARWAVGREFNRRMKQRFDALGIEMPYPTQKLVMDSAVSRYGAAEEKSLSRGVPP